MRRSGLWNQLGRVVGAGVGLAAAGAVAIADVGTIGVTPEMRAEMARKIGTQRCDIVEASVGKDMSGPMDVRIVLGGKDRTLHLLPHSVRGPNFHLLEQRADGKTYEVKAPDETTFRGNVDEDGTSMVAGGLMPDGMYAEVMLADGTSYWVQPVSGLVAGAPANLYGVYTHDDVTPGPWHCGNTGDGPRGDDDAGHAGGGGGSPFTPRGATLYTASLSTDADFEFFSRYGGTSAVNARIALIINIMNVQYERETDITHALQTMLVQTAEPDPYTSTDINTMLNQFRADWNANHAASRADVNQLFTGKDMDGNTIGFTFVGTVCGTSAYGWVQSDFNNNLMSATDLSAHELGHSWSASHCTCSGNGSTLSTMNPFITSINRFTFSNDVDNIAQIVAHRNSRSCLTTGSGGLDPRNDLCASAVQIGANTLIGWNNTGANNDGPAASCGTIGADTWYFYVAPCDGQVSVTTCGSNFDTFLIAYTGACGSLTEVACDDDNSACTGATLTSLITFNATRGTRYLIRAGGFNGRVGDGLIQVTQFCSAPANDNCASATTVGQGTFPFTTNAASTDGPLETGLCNNAGNSQLSNDVWFRYVGQCAGTVRISTCGSYDTKLAVYQSVCPSAPNTAIACNDDNGPACSGTSSSLDFTAAPGVAYIIRVGGFAGAVGSGNLTIASLACPAPVNDSCANPINVSGGGTFNGTNRGAFTDGTADCRAGFNDIFYSFVAPSAGTLTLTTCGTNDIGGTDLGVDTVLSVHTGCPATAANSIACDDDWPSSGQFPTACAGVDSGNSLDSAVRANLAAGQLVYIRVAQFASSGVSGAVRLNVSFGSGGACCCGSTCTVSEQAACAVSGGFFQGAGVACNPLGNNTAPCCRADFDHSGGLSVQDIFAFLNAWFSGNPCSDTNQTGGVTVQDIFDFLTDWFTGC